MKDPIQTAAQLDDIASQMQQLARILRGEEQDLTGFGRWRILCDRLEAAMDCKVITAEQYAAFCTMEQPRSDR